MIHWTWGWWSLELLSTKSDLNFTESRGIMWHKTSYFIVTSQWRWLRHQREKLFQRILVKICFTSHLFMFLVVIDCEMTFRQSALSSSLEDQWEEFVGLLELWRLRRSSEVVEWSLSSILGFPSHLWHDCHHGSKSNVSYLQVSIISNYSRVDEVYGMGFELLCRMHVSQDENISCSINSEIGT